LSCATKPVWDNIFLGLLRSGENFELSICNPPFHNSPDDVHRRQPA
jgi:23S rRNA (adenine1618-N6)-methyltransferase